MREELERIIREAQKRVQALRRDEAPMWDLVLIEVALYRLDDALKMVAAADSREGADFEAPEEPAASTH